jgi:hypothetical protein
MHASSTNNYLLDAAKVFVQLGLYFPGEIQQPERLRR